MVWKVKVEEIDPTLPGTTKFSGVSIGSTVIEVSDTTLSEENAKLHAIAYVAAVSGEPLSNYRIFEPVETTHNIINN
jgi:hypothetical protein